MVHNNKLPFISVMIVVRNEREYIEKSLSSLLNQTYPKDLTEIIIVDGMSTDGTREWLQKKVKELQKRKLNIKVLNNPKCILASGWNIGIKNAKGTIVCRIDAHSEICPDYVKKGVNELLRRKNEDLICVGGALENIGSGVIGKATANLFSSRFGVGNSAFRTTVNELKFTDTAVFGLYWKWIFEKVGYLDESLERNQDVALHSKILKNGYKLITDPNMKIKYYVRSTIPELIKKAFGDGYWVIYSQKSYLRHRIPLFFVLYLLSVPIVLLIFRSLRLSVWDYSYLLPLAFYIILSLCFSIRNGTSYTKLILPVLFPVFHVSYGLGSFKGMINGLAKRKK